LHGVLKDVVFDTPELRLRESGCLLRLRQAGSVVTLTYKGPSEPGLHKVREELETRLWEPRALVSVLARLGFEPVFHYEKYRTEYRTTSRAGTAMLDETPVGVYLELEGSARWIDRTARQLGFTQEDYITLSYGQLYLDWCRRNQVEPSNMVFS